MKIEANTNNPRDLRITDDDGNEISRKAMTAVHVSIEPNDLIRAEIHVVSGVDIHAEGKFFVTHPHSGDEMQVRAILFADGTTWAAKAESRIEEAAHLVWDATLSLIGYTVTAETFKGWSAEQRARVSEYAACVHLRASDNDDIVVPERPPELAAEPWGGPWDADGAGYTVL